MPSESQVVVFNLELLVIAWDSIGHNPDQHPDQFFFLLPKYYGAASVKKYIVGQSWQI